jgi:hypothetical protein
MPLRISRSRGVGRVAAGRQLAAHEDGRSARHRAVAEPGPRHRHLIAASSASLAASFSTMPRRRSAAAICSRSMAAVTG